MPEILLSGDHKKVEEWRLAQSLERTRQSRPDLYEKWAGENQDYFLKKAKKEERLKRKRERQMRKAKEQAGI